MRANTCAPPQPDRCATPHWARKLFSSSRHCECWAAGTWLPLSELMCSEIYPLLMAIDYLRSVVSHSLQPVDVISILTGVESKSRDRPSEAQLKFSFLPPDLHRSRDHPYRPLLLARRCCAALSRTILLTRLVQDIKMAPRRLNPPEELPHKHHKITGER